MDFYKIMNEGEHHYNMKYKTGLNIDINPFNPSCEPMGIYFSREDIFAYLDFYSYWIRKVTIPEDAQIQVFENPGSPKKWKSDKVILGDRKKINFKTIKKLIDEGANPKVNKSLVLQWASNKGYFDVVKLLIPLSDPKTNNSRALWWAAEKNHIDIVKSLIPLSDSRTECSYALHQAIKHGHKEIVKVLLPVSKTKTYGDWCLKLAINNGNPEIIKLVEEHNLNYKLIKSKNLEDLAA